jgi:hypothetical protein
VQLVTPLLAQLSVALSPARRFRGLDEDENPDITKLSIAPTKRVAVFDEVKMTFKSPCPLPVYVNLRREKAFEPSQAPVINSASAKIAPFGRISFT